MTDPVAPVSTEMVLASPEPLSDGLALAVRPPADHHPAAVYLARLAPGSRRTMRAALETIAGLLSGGRLDAEGLDWSALRYAHTAAVRSRLAEAFAPATASRMLSALRGVLREAWRLGQIPAEDFHRAADVPPVRGTSLPRGRALAMGELRALFEQCAEDERPAGARDAALLGVLYGAGLRRAEVVALDLADYRTEGAELRVRRGKGRKARITYTPSGCSQALERWLEYRGLEPGPLFCPVNKGGAITIRSMTDQAVLAVLARRARQAGVASFSPHDLRRSFISDLLDAGADISTVQQLAGHASVTTTARYDRRGDVTRRRAVDLLHVPYIGSRGKE